MTSYRLLYFEPLPGVEWHVPVGAMVRHGSNTTAVPAELQPDGRCLGGSGHAALLQYGQRVAAARAFFDHVPSELGDKFFLGDALSVPTAVENASEWLRRHVLPRNGRKSGPKQGRQPKRGTLGREFLKRRGVSELVRNELDLASLLPNTTYLKKPTHWVAGKEVTLLLEPIAPLGSSLETQVRDVYARLSSFGTAIGSTSENFALFAYVLSGPVEPGARLQMRQQLETVAEMVDTADDRQASEFMKRIQREAGELSLAP